MSNRHPEHELDRELDALIEAVLSGQEVPPTDTTEQQVARRLTEEAQALRMNPSAAAKLRAQLSNQRRSTARLNKVRPLALAASTGSVVRGMPYASLAALIVVVFFAAVLFAMGSDKTPGAAQTTPTDTTNSLPTMVPTVESVAAATVTSTPIIAPNNPTEVAPATAVPPTSTPIVSPVNTTGDVPAGRPAERMWLLAYSPDGKWLANGGCSQPAGNNCVEGKVQIRNLTEGGAEVRSLIVGSIVSDIAFRQDGNALAIVGCGTQGDDGRCIQGQIWLMNPLTGELEDQATTGTMTMLRVTFQEEKVVATSIDGMLWIWDRAKQRVTRQSFVEYQANFANAVFSADGRYFAFEGAQHAVYVWDLVKDQYVGQTPSTQTEEIRNLALSPDGKILAIAWEDHTIQLWTMNPRALVGGAPLSGHTDVISALGFGPHGKALASASVDGTIRLWDVNAAQLVGSPLTSDDQGTIFRLVFGPDGSQLVSSSADTIRLWDLDQNPVRSEVLRRQVRK